MALACSIGAMMGLPLHVVPLPFVQTFCDGAMRALSDRHRPLFERLAEFAGARILIDTVDLPVVFLLILDPRRPMLRVQGRGPSPAAIPYCLDLIGGACLESDPAVCRSFRPKAA